MWLLPPPVIAAIVAAPPPEAPEVGVLVCGEDCSDRMFWVMHEPALEPLPVVLLDTILAENAATAAEGEHIARSFRAHLDEARASLLVGKWMEADHALDDAQGELARWKGTPTNQELWTYDYLRGVTSIIAHLGDGHEAFEDAAAMAWNQDVTIPAGLEAYADPYYAALAERVAERPGTLVVGESSVSPTIALDGVPLGTPPLRVQVFAGVHRLTAVDTRRSLEWKAEVTVSAGRVTTAKVRFAGGETTEWAAAGLGAAVDERRMEAELADLLEDWADRNHVRRVRLLRLDPASLPPAPAPAKGAAVDPEEPVVDPLLLYTMTQVAYEPKVRRFSDVP